MFLNIQACKLNKKIGKLRKKVFKDSNRRVEAGKRGPISIWNYCVCQGLWPSLSKISYQCNNSICMLSWLARFFTLRNWKKIRHDFANYIALYLGYAGQFSLAHCVEKSREHWTGEVSADKWISVFPVFNWPLVKIFNLKKTYASRYSFLACNSRYA